ncbi:MAG: ABC transporter permease [Planctomycetia bacterium]|nr:ABC transporter permease [Planctomycetia bacterium]
MMSTLFIWIRTFQLGFKSLILHPMRSALTVLGIFIGVSSVIWLLAIGEGISQKTQEQIESLGATNIIVQSIKPPDDTTSRVRVLVYGLTRFDLESISEMVPVIKESYPIREIQQRFMVGDQRVDGRMVGCTPHYMTSNNLKMARGNFLTDTDCKEKRNYCVLSAEVAEELFAFNDPVGKSIRIGKRIFDVIGVCAPKSPSAGIGGSFSSQDFSRDVYIPIQTFWSELGDRISTSRSGTYETTEIQINQITFQVNSVEDVHPASELIKQVLEQNHRDKKDWAITVPLELLEQAQTTKMMFMLFMGLIAAISLLVGGIGIMNIMLATVTERTREIGIRRALGAKRSDIIRQFLAETITLSVMGGITGILGGLICSPVVEFIKWFLVNYFPRVTNQLPPLIMSMAPIIVPWSIFLAFGISMFIGIAFGLYPASRAAAMDPIEALRHE